MCTRLFVVLFGLQCFAQSGGTAHIVVNPAEVHQTVQGFGLNFTAPYFRDEQKSMFDMAINDLGVTMWRVVPYLVYSNWEETNDNDDPAVMNWEYYNERYSGPAFEASWKALRFLNSRGAKPILALMGPVPDWMVSEKWTPPQHHVCSPESRMPALNPAKYDEFAEMVVSMAVYARRKAGIDFEYFSPFNETDCYPPEGPRVDPEEAPKVLAAVARRLAGEGLGDVRLTVADNAVISNDYTGPILRDDSLMQHVGAIAVHDYGDGSVAPHVERVRNGKYPKTPVWLTEYGDLNDLDRSAENDWKNYSLTANRRALKALNDGAQALFYFDLFDDYEECAKRETYYGLFRSADHLYTPRKRYFATRQLYHFVRPGAQRVTATVDSTAMTVSGFLDRSSNSVILVGVKQGGTGSRRSPSAGRRRSCVGSLRHHPRLELHADGSGQVGEWRGPVGAAGRSRLHPGRHAQPVNSPEAIHPDPRADRILCVHSCYSLVLRICVMCYRKEPSRAFGRIVAIVVLTLASAWAADTGVSGQVIDPQGKVIPGATVQLLSEDRMAINQAKTDAEGKFQFAPVPPGDYRLTVDAPGFNTITRDITVRDRRAGLRDAADSPRLRSQSQSILITAKVLEPSVDLRNAEVFDRTLFTRDDQVFKQLNAGINAGQHEGGGKSLEIRRFGFNLDHGGVNGGLKVMVDDQQQNQGTQGHGQGLPGRAEGSEPGADRGRQDHQRSVQRGIRRFQRARRGDHPPAGVASGAAHRPPAGRELRHRPAASSRTVPTSRTWMPTSPMKAPTRMGRSSIRADITATT